MKAKSDISGILSCDHYRAYWVTWEKGEITVGSGTEFTHVVVTWTDPEPLHDTKYVSFGSYEGASADWKVMHDQGSVFVLLKMLISFFINTNSFILLYVIYFRGRAANQVWH